MKNLPDRLLIATKNKGKIREIRALLKDIPIILLPLSSFPHLPDVLEDGETFRENALKKARIIAHSSGIVTLADDSGLCIDALDGRPGVLSARYAGQEATDAEKCARILKEMEQVPERLRTATFVCIIALVTPQGEEIVFKGTCEGIITHEIRGAAGFGYDPIFYYPGSGCTFAEMDSEAKNRVSHRGRALHEFRNYLEELSR
ncbi:MAG: XTP/dITP diphosphatase [Desulfomonilaceae bacterium]